jgi:hypothetical protein
MVEQGGRTVWAEGPRNRPRTMRLTLVTTSTHTANVIACRFFRRSVTAVAVLAVLTLGVLPAEHFHAVGTEDSHREDVVHRHWDLHNPVGAGVPVAHEDDHATLWMDSSLTHPEVVSHLSRDAQGALVELLVPQRRDASRHTLPFVRLSVHDPPGITSNGLRAPPSLFLVA